MALTDADLPKLVELLNQIDIRVQKRRRTAADWTALNEVLLSGEEGLETDTKKRKIGDGVTAWNALPYTGLQDAPADGKTYGRQDGDWAEVLAGGGGGGPWNTLSKAADEARSSTATLADDSDLSVALPAGKHVIRLLVLYSIANATMDFKYSLAFSGTVTSAAGFRRLLQAGSTGAEIQQLLAGFPTSSMTSTVAGSGYLEVVLFADLATAGTLTFQWAQNTSDAGTLKVLAGSMLEYMTAGATGGGGGPGFFHAHRSTSYTTPAGTGQVVVPLDTVVENTVGTWDAVNSELTVSKAGLYQVIFARAVPATAVQAEPIIAINAAGSSLPVPAGSAFYAATSNLFRLAAGDKVRAHVYRAAAVTITVPSTGGLRVVGPLS